MSASDAIEMVPKVPNSITNAVIGPLLIGSYVNCILWGLVLSQIWAYFSRFPGERGWIRILVFVIMFIDALAICDECATLYLYGVTHWNDPSYLSKQGPTYTVYVVTQCIGVVSMHGFLITRYHILSKRWYITLPLAMVAALSFIGQILLMWAINVFTTLEERIKLTTYAYLYLASSAAADVLIATALSLELLRVKTSFRKTRSIVQRLLNASITTGAVTASFAILSLVTFIARPTTNIAVGFGFCIGRMCSLTVMLNLNLRKHEGRIGSTNVANTTVNSIPLDTGFRFTSHGQSQTNGITVHQQSVVHVESTKARSDRDMYDDRGSDSKVPRDTFV
ncbi:hypothetical protein BKA62DRAFT_636327 [Auriculariales sp. MPI-PUGE-AT-0066]|nr:hypothetical protein BKA62DRAFT_636327 [Auriculariales sp. MPI-PUGE-AT-0066]